MRPFFANFYPLWSDEMMISKRWINFNAKGGLANASLSFPFPYLWRYQVSRDSKRRENEWQIKMQAESSLSSHPNAAHESTAEKCKDENPKVKLFCHEKKGASTDKKERDANLFPQSNRWRDLNCCQSENANEFDPSGEITFYNGEREAIELNKMEKKWSLICQFIVRIKKTSSFFAGLSTMKESFLWGTVQP